MTAQTSADAAPGFVPAGGEMDNYLRYLQTLGDVDATPWSLRSFSTRDARALEHVRGVHPWSGQALFDSGAIARAPHLIVLPIEASVRYNTSYPVGGNDGPVWAGRGATVSASAGAMLDIGQLHVRVDPLGFLAQNQSFALQHFAGDSARPFLDPDFPLSVDRPQRFGRASYGRVDPGESYARLDTRFVTVGATTANQYWGPATTYPFILGNNAPGIPQIFLGTGQPVSIGIGRVQARVTYGIEHQSAFSPVVGPDTFTTLGESGKLRFMSGLVVTYQPRGIEHLELGAGRFFHDAWEGHVTAANLRAPFEGLVKHSLPRGTPVPGVPDTTDALRNQLASIFFRWVFPHSGFEVYGEYGHEDHNLDTRDLEGEPDHSRTAMLGLRKVLTRDAHSFYAFRAEVMDGTESTVARHRGEGAIYIHGVLSQGHTYEGQLLGANVGFGSPAGAIAAVDHYSMSGRTTWFVTRTAQDNIGEYFVNGIQLRGSRSIDGAVGIEHLVLRRYGDVFGSASYDYRTRPFGGARGANLNLQLGLRAHL